MVRREEEDVLDCMYMKVCRLVSCCSMTSVARVDGKVGKLPVYGITNAMAGQAGRTLMVVAAPHLVSQCIV
jgi:hypothetical protein